MFRRHKTEVLVVGAGPVGLYSALRLADSGVDVEIVDKQWRSTGQSYALALHPSTLRLLDEAGIVGELIEEGRCVNRIALMGEGKRQAELRFDELPGEFPFLLVLPQSALESVLERRLRRAGVRVRWNHRVSRLDTDGRRAVAQVDKLDKVSVGYAVAAAEWVIQKTFPMEAAFVIGADGHGSVVRKASGIEFDSFGEPELFAVFEFYSGPKPGHEVRIVLENGLANVLWQLPGDRWRWGFQVQEGEVRENRRAKSPLAVQIGRGSFPHVEKERLVELIEERAPWFASPVGDLRWSMAVRFERRLARRFGRDNVWLAGDAAHLTGPVGVHSMNVGLHEAEDLARGVVEVLRGELSKGAMESYNRERLSEWRQLLGVEAAFETGSETSAWVKENGASILPCLPASGDDLKRLGSQIGLEMGSRQVAHPS